MNEPVQDLAPPGKPLLRQRSIAIVVLFILTIYGFEAHARRRALSTPPSMGDQGAYLAYARHQYESNYAVVEDRNRMPIFPFLLSRIYEPGLSEAEFLTRAQAFNVNLSILLLFLALPDLPQIFSALARRRPAHGNGLLRVHVSRDQRPSRGAFLFRQFLRVPPALANGWSLRAGGWRRWEARPWGWRI